MKTRTKKPKLIRDFDQLTSQFSEEEIIHLQSMRSIRGGDGADDGSGTIIIIPPPPPSP
jgi:hypothetical protein